MWLYNVIKTFSCSVFFSCIMYIVSYISKAERELGVLLKTAQEEARQGGNVDAVKELRQLGQIYINHREVRNCVFFVV